MSLGGQGLPVLKGRHSSGSRSTLLLGEHHPCGHPDGVQVCHAGYRTYFTTAADLDARCHRAAVEGRWAATMRFYAGPTLQVVSQRYLKTSIVITIGTRQQLH